MTDADEPIDDSLVEWANNSELTPRRVRRGEDAAVAGRAMLEAAGIDVEQVERKAARRPMAGSNA